MSNRTVFSLAVFFGASLYLVNLSVAGATMHGQNDGSQGGAMGSTMKSGMIGEGLTMPSMNPTRGRKLFASKGCVVCHSINGIGGEDALPLDAATMARPMDPFEFAAKMWRGAEAMIYLQREELGEQIELTGIELSDIIAFAHHDDEQKNFSEADIPMRIRELMAHVEEEPHEDEEAHDSDKKAD